MASMHPQLAHTIWMVGFAAIGASVYWNAAGKTQLRAFAIGRVLDSLIHDDNLRGVLEYLIFTTLGCIIVMGIVHPDTSMQALSGGLGWTGLLVHQADK